MYRKVLRFAIINILLICSTTILANQNTSKIETIYIHTEYGDGDVVFTTQEKDSTCYGYWLSPSQPGFDQIYSALLSAYYSKIQVSLYFSLDTSEKWPGSGNFYCRLIRLQLDS